MFQFSLIKTTDDQYVTVFIPGRDPLPANASHPNFKAIVAACAASTTGEITDADVDGLVDLFDVAAAVQRKFQRLSERVSVEGNEILLDGEPVHNSLTKQILAFMDEGEDFEPLVNFYEKLLTNPLHGVRETLYGWLEGQMGDESKVTICEDGDLVGYKGVWVREGGYRPSKMNTTPIRVSDTLVPVGEYATQNVGDVVEMPRAAVDAPSHECGVGLHVGTWNYAKTFGPVCLKVKFSPRDVVSAPDANASWKVRVIRYTVLEVVEDSQAHASAVYRPMDAGSHDYEWDDESDHGDEDTF